MPSWWLWGWMFFMGTRWHHEVFEPEAKVRFMICMRKMHPFFFFPPCCICSLSFLIPWHSISGFWILIYPSLAFHSLFPVFFFMHLFMKQLTCTDLSWTPSVVAVVVSVLFLCLIERPQPEGCLKATLILREQKSLVSYITTTVLLSDYVARTYLDESQETEYVSVSEIKDR